jgi:tripartite-type tricarboxylate transporter receptor subunit TctC
MPRLNSIRALVTCFVLLMPATPLWAEDYPSKPIRILAGAAPGGLIDLFARTFAQRLQERSGQPVVVENNSVATGTIAPIWWRSRRPMDTRCCWAIPRTSRSGR